MSGAGDLNAFLRFEAKVEKTVDGAQTLSEWIPQFSCRAAIIPLVGGEGVQQQRLEGTQPVRIKVRSSAESRQIKASWRAIERMRGGADQYYALKTVEDMSRDGAYLTMIAVAGDADGR